MPESEIDIIPKGLHHTEHEIGGIDEVDVTDLSGQLADAQPALAHQASHISGADLLDLNATSLENLLINGDFEVGDPPIGWILNGAGATVARSAVQQRINAYSAALTRVGNNCRIQQDCQATKGIAYFQGRIVSMGCWVWASVANRARLRLTDGVAYQATTAYHPGDSAWHWLSATGTMDAGATLLNMHCAVDDGNTTAYFDGAILVEGSLCPAFSSKPAELIIQETQIYAAAPPIAWTDLDISALLGIEIGSALVMLKVTETANVSNNGIAFRRNGDADEMYLANSVAYAMASRNSTSFGVAIVFTDENGVVEWNAGNANAVTCDVMGYVKC